MSIASHNESCGRCHMAPCVCLPQTVKADLGWVNPHATDLDGKYTAAVRRQIQLSEELAETKAALETAHGALHAELDNVTGLTLKLDAARSELASVHAAWAEQLRDLLPRVGLRALEGVPDEVKALLGSEKGASDGG